MEQGWIKGSFINHFIYHFIILWCFCLLELESSSSLYKKKNAVYIPQKQECYIGLQNVHFSILLNMPFSENLVLNLNFHKHSLWSSVYFHIDKSVNVAKSHSCPLSHQPISESLTTVAQLNTSLNRVKHAHTKTLPDAHISFRQMSLQRTSAFMTITHSSCPNWNWYPTLQRNVLLQRSDT